MKLKNKRVVITGASRGLGRALAFRFSEEGARLALCARSTEALNRVGLEISLKGYPPLLGSCDIADHAQVDRFASMVLEELGGVDVLVNNAAQLGTRIEVAEWTASAWSRIIDVNVNGLFLVSRAFLPGMIKQRTGSIINVSSSVGKQGRQRWGAYGVSKFALEGFTQMLADEVRTKGVRVNSVNPGRIDTDMRHAAYPDEDRTKLPSPTEVLDVFVHLASDQSCGITGQYFDAQEFLKNKKEHA
jgi:NAD(P)-dependent dehydrogenase (short-subunit alcohol dehydrogenase family)